jgi:hypothetical protein
MSEVNDYNGDAISFVKWFIPENPQIKGYGYFNPTSTSNRVPQITFTTTNNCDSIGYIYTAQSNNKIVNGSVSNKHYNCKCNFKKKILKKLKN